MTTGKEEIINVWVTKFNSGVTTSPGSITNTPQAQEFIRSRYLAYMDEGAWNRLTAEAREKFHEYLEEIGARAVQLAKQTSSTRVQLKHAEQACKEKECQVENKENKDLHDAVRDAKPLLGRFCPPCERSSFV